MNREFDYESVIKDFAALREEDQVYVCYFLFHTRTDIR